MIKLQSTRDSAVWLNHRELVKLEFEKYCDDAYELKSEIFNFKRKPKSENRRKRTRTVSANTVPISTEISELQEATEEFTKMCANQGLFSEDLQTDIERVWEEQCIFPKFNGGNASDDFHTYSLNNREYLIPPLCRFFNYDVLHIDKLITEGQLGKFDFISMDPPWKNKYVRRLKRVKTDLGYNMMKNDLFQQIPIEKLTAKDSILVIWCTNCTHHQNEIVENFLPAWKMKLVKKLYWVKLNTDGTTICTFNEPNKKQPYEVAFVAIQESSIKDLCAIQNVKVLLSIPSIIHSHKPPIFKIFEDVLPNQPKCLDIFSRYLQPNFTSIGLETLKLMDFRLYTKLATKII